MISPAQLSWVINYVPPWLSVILVLFGIGIVPVSRFIREEIQTPIERMGIIIAAIGACVYFYGGFTKLPAVTMGLILMFASYIEGLSGVRFWQKVVSVIEHRRLGVAHTGGLKRRLIALLLTLFTAGLIVWILVGLVVWGPIELEAEYTIRLMWTLITVTASLLGLTAKYWTMTEDFPAIELFGVMSIIVGAEIYNMTGFTADLTVYLLTLVAYNCGYLIAVYRLYIHA